tara:strand:- start:289 stop:585 length:297 start_codon:yes stop_codon:yes gene_type:complete
MEQPDTQTDKNKNEISVRRFWDTLSRIDSLTVEIGGLRIELRETQERLHDANERIQVDAEDFANILDDVDDLQYLLKKERAESSRLRQLLRMSMVSYE